MMLASKRNSNFLLSKANLERDAKRWAAAGELYRAYLKQKPDSAAIWVQLGHALKESGDLDGAEQAYARSIALDRDVADSYLQLGHLLKVKNRLPEAIENYRRALELQPDLHSAALELTALGADSTQDASAFEILDTLPEKVDVLIRRLETLESAYMPAARQMAAVLDRSAAIKAFGFELQRHGRDYERHATELTEVRTSVDRLATEVRVAAANNSERVGALERQLPAILEHVASSKATALGLVRLETVVKDLGNDFRSGAAETARASHVAERRLDGFQKTLEAAIAKIQSENEANHAAASRSAAGEAKILRAEAKEAWVAAANEITALAATVKDVRKQVDLSLAANAAAFAEALKKSESAAAAANTALSTSLDQRLREMSSRVERDRAKDAKGMASQIAGLGASVIDVKKQLDSSLARQASGLGDALKKSESASAAANAALSASLDRRLHELSISLERAKAYDVASRAATDDAFEQRVRQLENALPALAEQFAPHGALVESRQRLDELADQLTTFATIERVERMVRAVAAKVPAPDAVQTQIAPALESMKALERRCQDLEVALAETQKSVAAAPQGFDDRINAFSARMDELGRMGAEAADTAQGVADRVAVVEGGRHVDQTTLDYLLKRVEFVRREVLFELQHAPTKERAGAALQAVSKIVNVDKAAQHQGCARLNLGCGHVPIDSYLNIDRRELPGVDIVAEVDELPFAEGQVQEIFSAHMLEHFPQEELIRKLLPYWFRLLAPGGSFAAIVPDAATMIAKAANDGYAFDEFREVFFGAQDYTGDFHYNMFTSASLKQILEKVGFVDVEVTVEGRRNGACYEMELTAKKPQKR